MKTGEEARLSALPDRADSAFKSIENGLIAHEMTHNCDGVTTEVPLEAQLLQSTDRLETATSTSGMRSTPCQNDSIMRLAVRLYFPIAHLRQ
jgi:hypothetical protein